MISKLTIRRKNLQRNRKKIQAYIQNTSLKLKTEHHESNQTLKFSLGVPEQ